MEQYASLITEAVESGKGDLGLVMVSGAVEILGYESFVNRHLPFARPPIMDGRPCNVT